MSAWRPLLLDLFCGAGGAAMGYHRAGFDVVGVDSKSQPNYPFKLIQGDALEVLGNMIDDEAIWDYRLIHASPPCQRFSSLAGRWNNAESHPDLIDETRWLLKETSRPYVIENVPQAPLQDPIILCGLMFDGLRVIRHRAFETSFELTSPPHPEAHPLCFTYDKRKAHYGKLDDMTAFVTVTGGGNSSLEAARDAMGIPWMKRREISEAIPPAYTECIGRRFFEQMERRYG